MELVAGDGRVIELAEIADLGYDAAKLVVALDGVEYLLVGKVHAVDLFHGSDDLLFDLAAEVACVPLALFGGHVDAADEELVVRDELAVLKILLHAVHGGAAFLTDEGGDEVVAAFKGTLQNALGVRAGAVCHVISRKVGIDAARCSEPHAEAAVDVQQRLRYVRAVVRKRKFALRARLLHELVVCLLEEALEINQML